MDPTLLPLLRELGDLKRVTSAGRPGSIAERCFGRAWAALIGGASPEAVAVGIAVDCLSAIRLGDLDPGTLGPLGLPEPEVAAIRRAALDEVTAALAPDLRHRLSATERVDEAAAVGLPGFVEALAAQPRAGVTSPGRARIVLLPAENHAEHCLMVAVYGVLLAEPGCDLGTVALASLAHHLHNAALPDAGFTGEVLLGRHLGPVTAAATEAALAELPSGLAADIRRARRILDDAETPEGRAFHAADVIDRVLEIEQHLVRGRLARADILGEMALVHDGPVKPYHDRVLARMGLA